MNYKEFKKDDLIILSYFNRFASRNKPKNSEIIYKRLFIITKVTEEGFEWRFVQDLYIKSEEWKYANSFFDDDDLYEEQGFLYNIIEEYYTDDYIFERLGPAKDFPEYFI
jgi:hypothetical protein